MSTPTKSVETEPMKAIPASRRIMAAIMMGMAIAVVGSEPAFAQASGIQDALESIISLITGGVGKAVAILAIAGVGFAWLTGRMNFQMAFVVVCGIALIFGAPELAAMLGAG